MKLPRRRFLHLAASAAALPFVSRFAWAQSYSLRPIFALWARERTVDYTGDKCRPLFSQFGWVLIKILTYERNPLHGRHVVWHLTLHSHYSLSLK